MVEFIFEDMVDSLKFDLSERTLRDCIRFCFMTILQKELGGITTETTNHLVGLPTHLYGTANHMISSTLQKLTNLLILPAL